LAKLKLDAWGGPDRPHENFTALQRAMGYTMASVFTTGGIRGGNKRIGWFQPRSFNMGISRKVFQVTGGFKFTRYAEDIEFSIRMKEAGFNVGLINKAYVYHKRRTNLAQFFNQVFNFGRGRAMVGKLYASEVKIAHWFPTFFTISLIVLLAMPWINYTIFIAGLIAFCSYLGVIFVDALIVNKNIGVAVLSIPSAIIQLTGYGLGFFKETLKTGSPRRR
jgi:cellulose synthase/poly-beta-1,6-N-acetylglucosamine synthase-like glycosyltransferase